MDELDKELKEILDSLPDTQMGCEWCGKKIESFLVFESIAFGYYCKKCSKKERIINLPDCEC